MRERSRRPDRKYAAIPNEAMRDKRLSAEARGVLAYLMTFSDDWTFHRDRVMEDMALGRDRFQRVMAELREAGYVQLEVVRTDGGQLLGSTWVIRDEPDCNIAESLKTRSPAESLKNRQPAKPTAGKSGPLRIPTGKKTNSEEDQDLFGSVEPQRNVREAKAEKQDRFDEFWTVYPKKAGKPAAQKAWDKAVKKADPEKIIAAARVYAGTDGVARGFVKYPQGWLNEERFNDADLQPPPPRSQRYVYHAGGLER